jgi:hypothetical protein
LCRKNGHLIEPAFERERISELADVIERAHERVVEQISAFGIITDHAHEHALNRCPIAIEELDWSSLLTRAQSAHQLRGIVGMDGLGLGCTRAEAAAVWLRSCH